MTLIGHGSFNLVENEYTFEADGSYATYSKISSKEVAESEIEPHKDSATPGQAHRD
jgi:hypothetical protein